MLLVIETATEACSVALFDDGRALAAERHEIVGRGHAERLVPQIAELLGNRRPDRVLVDCGPGSFTGVRVGLAAARAVSLGWQARLRGFSSLALIAAGAFAKNDAPDRLAVAINGGHGEMFVQQFRKRPFAACAPFASLTPMSAASVIADRLIVGSASESLVAARGHGEAVDAHPRAAEAMLLPAACVTLAPRPVYGRAPDARPMS